MKPEETSYRQVAELPSDPMRVCVTIADAVQVRWLEAHGPEERRVGNVPEALVLAETMRAGLGLAEVVVLLGKDRAWQGQWGRLVPDHRANEPLGNATEQLSESEAAGFAAAIEAERDA